MRIGLMSISTGTIDEAITQALKAEADGFDNLWMANIFGLDAISTLGIIGHVTSRIALGTAVTPTYPRHPTAIAQQALTTGAAAGGRFSLGIGLSHQIVIENMLGMSYDKPARHMREYLSVLAPLLRGETTSFAGDQYTVNSVGLNFPGRQPVPLLVAALGPVMLKLAGTMADGTITWMTGPKTLASHIIPGINEAANEVGKANATIVAGFPIVATDDIDGARKQIGESLQMYGMLPSYRAMLDREGIAGPAELALVGNEAYLRDRLKELEQIGVTDFCAAISASDQDSTDRTNEFLKSVL